MIKELLCKTGLSDNIRLSKTIVRRIDAEIKLMFWEIRWHKTVPDILKENKIFLVPTTEAYCQQISQSFFHGEI